MLSNPENEFSFSISPEFMNCFLSFFDMMKGFSFYFENFDFPSLKYLIDYVQIPCLYLFISSKMLFPQTLEESLQFLSLFQCESLEEQFNQRLSIIIQNFHLLSFYDLKQLSNDHLLKIFSSDSFQIETEDHLFQLIVSMVEEDNNRIILLKTVHFEFVSSHLLKKFFENIQYQEIDIDLFESLKKKLFEDYSNQQRLLKRWESKPKYLSEMETNDIFGILDSYFEEERNPVEKIKLLVDQNKQFQEEIDSFRMRILQLEEENYELKEEITKRKTIFYQNEHHGILQYLKQSEIYSFTLNCSNFTASHVPENILAYDISIFQSQNHPNSWLCVKFNQKRVLLSGYLFRSWYGTNHYNPKSWTLEASNDYWNWILIDRKINQEWVAQNFSETYFPVETTETFSYFKFCQSDVNESNAHYFVLNLVELFGTILYQ
jgi:hypothetical protein